MEEVGCNDDDDSYIDDDDDFHSYAHYETRDGSWSWIFWLLIPAALIVSFCVVCFRAAHHRRQRQRDRSANINSAVSTESLGKPAWS